MDTFPEHVIDWLYERGLSDKTILSAGLQWNGRAIVIPIKDSNGNILFNKYRRDPADKSEGMKYWQDKGATAQLYSNVLWDGAIHDETLICEGEFDVMIAHEYNYHAVCSTGGAGTFRDEWIPELYSADDPPYIIYDNDDAGWMGAQKVAIKLGKARICVLPDKVGRGGDLTDFLTKFALDYNEINLKKLLAEAVKIDVRDLTTVTAVKEKLKELTQIERYNSQRHEKRVELGYIRQYLLNLRDQIRRSMEALKKANKPKPERRLKNAEKIEYAKSYPMEELYNGQLKSEAGNRLRGRCELHNDSTPSFVIYTETNSWFCYGGCQTGGDTIDYVQEKHGLSFKYAIEKLNSL